MADFVGALVQLIRFSIEHNGKSDKLLLLSGIGLLYCSNLMFIGWMVHMKVRMPEVLTRDVIKALIGSARSMISQL